MARACVIVLDAVGAGELPDAAEFGDEGSNTLGNVARAVVFHAGIVGHHRIVRRRIVRILGLVAMGAAPEEATQNETIPTHEADAHTASPNVEQV